MRLPQVAQRFAEQLDATTAWEHALGVAAPDAVVFASGFHWSLIPSRRKELERWVEDGGRLVTDNQLLGTEEFGRWSGITREFPKVTKDDDVLRPLFEQYPGMRVVVYPADKRRSHPIPDRGTE